MASPQLGNGYIGIANEIWDEIISRKFTERQQKILKLVLRLSYGCQKKEAVIPLLKHFELCGVRIQDAKKEIVYLQQCKVIMWDGNQVYSLNKNYDEWRVNLVKEWDKDKFSELISINLSVKKVTKSVTQKSDQHPESYEKCNSGVTKSVNEELRKVEVEEGSNPCESKADGGSKDMFKDSIKVGCCLTDPDSIFEPYMGNPDSVPKTEADTDSDREVSQTEYRNQVAARYLQRRGKGLEITLNDEDAVKQFIAERIPLQTVIDGIDQAFNNFKPKNKWDQIRNLSYCATVVYSLHAKREKSNTAEIKLVTSIPNAPIETASTVTADDLKELLANLRSKQGV
ncbi:putative prophage replication protein O [Paenibacillus sp. FSL R5-192]|uniref:replication protein n=1 Tax=Paenibacillus sp. FSL R5-192 TaxID=1226754 RepID=UPI0003E20833|nr:replication protein [Paenibacillus sp. FSL R5-192]ETT30692.1 putative prophage replication protein O [Paenibacillus sp. FSL R5-192]